MNFRVFSILLLIYLFGSIITAQDKSRRDSLELKLENSEKFKRLNILLELSKINWSISPQKGITYADSAYQLAKRLNNNHLRAKALLYGGVNYWSIGSYDKAIEYYHNSLKIAEENNDEEIEAFLFNNIGMVHYELGEYKKAQDNYSKAANILKHQNNEIEYAKIIDNIANIYHQMHEYDKALKNYLSILDVIKTENNEKFLLWVLSDIGLIYFETEKFDLALDYYLQALEISNKISDNVGKTMVLNYLGELSLKKKDYNNALFYLKEGLKFAEEAGAKDRIKKTYDNLSQYYSAVGNYKKSLEYFKLFKAISDSIHNSEKEEKILEIQTKYEIATKEKENALLSKDNKIQLLEIGRQTAINIYLIIFIILAFAFVILILSRLKVKKLANLTLSKKNEIIIIQNKEIKIQSDKLTESNASKDKLFSIIAHDLKNPFNSILGYTKLLTSEYNSFTDDERKDIIMDIDKAAKNTFYLLDNMLTWAISQQNGIEIKKEKQILLDIIDNCVESNKLLAEQKGIKLFIDIPHKMTLSFDKQTMTTVFINLISNAIKFTPTNGSIKISSKQTKEFTDICIEDTGLGMDNEILNSLFLTNKSKIRMGTNNEKGTGLGLLICKDFIHKNGGKINVKSEVGKGSQFTISIPNLL